MVKEQVFIERLLSLGLHHSSEIKLSCFKSPKVALNHLKSPKVAMFFLSILLKSS